MWAIIKKTSHFTERLAMNIKNALKNLGAAVLYLGIYLGCQFAVAFGALFFVGDVNKYLAHLSVIASVLTIAIYILIFVLRRKNVTVEIGIKKIRPVSYVLMPIFGAAVNVIMAYILALIPFPESWLNEYETAISMITAPNDVMAIIYTVLLAPLCEEITIRGLAHTRIRRILPSFAAMIISSCIFGMIHGITIQVIYASLLGLLLAWVFEKSDSLLASILFHIGFNTCGLLIPLYHGNLPILVAVCTAISVGTVMYIQNTSERKIEFIGKY